MNKIEVLIFSVPPLIFSVLSLILSIYLEVIIVWCFYDINEIAGIIIGIILLKNKIVWLWQGYNILKGGK